MGNFIFETILKDTNSGIIGLAKKDGKSVFCYKQNKDLNEMIFLHQLFVMQKNKNVFNNNSSLPIYNGFQPFEDGTYYLLPKQEGNFLIDKICRMSKQKIHFEETQIKNYLKQLLEALFQLHKLDILGRVFSVYNIFETNENKIVLYDFGFAAKIEQDELPILAPPEYFLNLNKLKQNQSITQDKFDLKFDVWLIGVFLYHLIKRAPICLQRIGNTNEGKMYKYKYLDDYLQTNYKQTISSENFSKDLIDLVNSLINVDFKNRNSVKQLYLTEYVKQLKVENYDEKLKFYSENEHLSLQKFYLDPFKSNISNLDNISQFSSETSVMRSFICPGFQEIIKFKTDPENEEILFHCQIFSLKMHILKKLNDFLLQNNQASELSNLVQKLQFHNYYQALIQIQFFSNQISNIFSKAKKYGDNCAIELQHQCLLQIDYQIKKFQNSYNQPIQIDFQRLGINKLSSNQQLIIMCCLILGIFFQKHQIEECMKTTNLQFKVIEFPNIFYELLERGEELQQRKILDYLQKKFPIKT